jgi:hypothetical protein
MLQLTCSRCGHIGAPGHVDPGGGMLRLTCSSCGGVHVMLPDGSMALIVASAPDAAGTSAHAPVTDTQAATPAELGDASAQSSSTASTTAPVAATRPESSATPSLAKYAVPAPAPAVTPTPAPPVAPAPVSRDEISVPDIAVQPVDLPPVKCPKCGHRQHETESCHRCGLVFSMVKPGFAPWDDYGELARPHLPRARELWQAVESFPANDAAHDAFVQHCRKTGLLLFAASRYRHFLSDYPGHTLSEKWLAQVVRDATAMAGVMRSQQDEFMAAAARAKTIMLVTVVSLTVLAMIALMWMMSRQQSIGPW